jgi:gamma-glutamylcyclotransferase (GGCT)/AIG2-like uncharacterized protein YtfP
MTQYLFSYGTLQPDLAPAEIAPLVRKFRRVGRGYIHGFLYDFGDYPGAVLGKTQQRVWGQVFVFPDDPELLRQLDEYEEFDPSNLKHSQFVRQKCGAVLATGRAIQAWVYVYNRPPGSAPRIENGDFARIPEVNRKSKG